MELIEQEALLKEFPPDEFPQSIDLRARIVQAPAIDAAPVVHGRVLDNGNPICGPCSVCGESINRRARYCSMCGARMDGGEGGKDDG